MTTRGSVTYWVEQLKAGDQAALQKVWERYFQRLVLFARKKLQGSPRRAADEEDVALSAFDSFYRGVKQDRFPRLADRNDLWQLLVVLTKRKAIALALRERRQKRGGGKAESQTAGDYESEEGQAFANLISRDPDPELAALVADECQRLLAKLESPELTRIAVLKMEGYTTEEIAVTLGRSVRTVERKLRLIHTTLEDVITP
jgi:DNA-directed RNA polymerase specialized sigma24 family protein